MENIEKRIKELEEMIHLAEKVSSNISFLKHRWRVSLVRSSVVAFAIGLVPFFIAESLNIIDNKYVILVFRSFPFIMLFSWLGVNTIYYKQLKEIIEVESKILRKLLNTIFPYKNIIFKQPHNMKMKEAIIDMRLSRLKFTYKIDVSEKTEENEISPIENIRTPQPKEPATTT